MEETISASPEQEIPLARSAPEPEPVQNGHETSEEPGPENDHGSSVPDAIFNFTNSIVGAGCIGLGGAIALSGGLISIALVIFFAVLTKLSLDLLIRLSVESTSASDGSVANASYEDLAERGMGYWKGRVPVMVCKLSYSFGCLVAYVIVIKDNCGPALLSLIYGEGNDNGPGADTDADSVSVSFTYTGGEDSQNDNSEWFHRFLEDYSFVTWAVSLALILPLCLLRDMTPLAFGSLISVVSMVTIVGIVIYIYFACPDVRQEPTGGFYENWLEIRPGVLSNLGTFIFTFVSQHTVHLVFSSLKPSLRTVAKWKVVSSLSILAAATVSLLVGVFVYITFWQNTKSDIFQIYPHGWMIDTAKLLLCVTMVFTFPLPFFTCRELLILTVVHPLCGIHRKRSSEEESRGNDAGRVGTDAECPEVHEDENDSMSGLQRPLLSEEPASTDNLSVDDDTMDALPSENSEPRSTPSIATPQKWLLPDDDRQLVLSGHVFLTTQIWLVVTGLAIAAPSLGDILDLVGCASGTLIAFVIPGLLSFSVEGYTHLGMLIFTVGGAVGTVGTYYSIKQLVNDL